MENKHLYINEYGCVKCQIYHNENEPIYKEHIMFQSKHGIRRKIILTERRNESHIRFSKED